MVLAMTVTMATTLVFRQSWSQPSRTVRASRLDDDVDVDDEKDWVAWFRRSVMAEKSEATESAAACLSASVASSETALAAASIGSDD